MGSYQTCCINFQNKKTVFITQIISVSSPERKVITLQQLHGNLATTCLDLIRTQVFLHPPRVTVLLPGLLTEVSHSGTIIQVLGAITRIQV